MTQTDYETPRVAPAGVAEALRRNWVLLLVLGILLIVGGVAAIVLPVVASLAVTITVGAALLVGGGFKAVHAFRCGGWRCRGWSIASAVLYVIGGLLLLFNPLAGMVSLTVVMIMLIGADSVLRMIMAFRIRPDRGWGWLMVGGIVGLLLAIGMMVMLPWISLTALGILAGIALIFEGWGFVALALAARRGDGGVGTEVPA
jgi:uncharacterized membrane protein HdeD (DUF308 family)